MSETNASEFTAEAYCERFRVFAGKIDKKTSIVWHFRRFVLVLKCRELPRESRFDLNLLQCKYLIFLQLSTEIVYKIVRHRQFVQSFGNRGLALVVMEEHDCTIKVCNLRGRPINGHVSE